MKYETTHYATPALRYQDPMALIQHEREKSSLGGYFFNPMCEVCGKQKGKKFNHRKCSAIKQKRHSYDHR